MASNCIFAMKLRVFPLLISSVIFFFAAAPHTAAFVPSRQFRTNTIHVRAIKERTHSILKTKPRAVLHMSATEEERSSKSNLPMLLDPGTKGGALFLSLVLFIIPIIGYEVATLGFGFDEIEAGKWIGVGFTLLTCVLWVSTYIFRVATKDMTYVSSFYICPQRIVFLIIMKFLILRVFSFDHNQAKQLKDYENAVIAKRLEELDEDEIQALVEDIERDDF